MFREVWQFIRSLPYQKAYFIYNIIYVFLCLGERLFSFFSFYLLGDIANPNRSLKSILFLLGLIVLTEVSSQTVAFVANMFSVKQITETEQRLGMKAVHKLLYGTPSLVQNINSGDIMSRLQNDLPQYVKFISTIGNAIIVLPANLIMVILSLVIDWRLCISSLGICVFQLFISKWLQKKKVLYSKEKKIEFTKGLSIMLEAFHAALSMRWMPSLQNQIIRNHFVANREIYLSDTRERDTNTQISLLDTLAAVLGEMTFLLVGGLLVYYNMTSLGVFLAIYSIRFSLTSTFTVYENFRGGYMEYKVNKERIQMFWEIEPEEVVIEKDSSVSTWIDKQEEESALVFSNVSFAYFDETPVLRNISFQLKQNDIVKVSGISGSGKSTLFALAQGFLLPSDGEIFYFGKPSAELPNTEKRKLVYCFSQRFYLFHSTIAENIRFGASNVTLEKVKKAAKQAQIDAFIQNLPNGYETILNNNGNMLSAGQRQRLMVARAFLANRPIWLLDEITAALDPQTGVDLEKAMLPLLSGKAVLFSTHKDNSLFPRQEELVLPISVIQKNS